jgi:hypothetical protein
LQCDATAPSSEHNDSWFRSGPVGTDTWTRAARVAIAFAAVQVLLRASDVRPMMTEVDHSVAAATGVVALVAAKTQTDAGRWSRHGWDAVVVVVVVVAAAAGPLKGAWVGVESLVEVAGSVARGAFVPVVESAVQKAVFDYCCVRHPPDAVAVDVVDPAAVDAVPVVTVRS